MERKHFIVLSGEAGNGKDSTADILVREYNYHKISLSGEMKHFVMQAFGWSHDQLYGPSSMRNVPDPKWARPCKNCEGIGYFIYKSSGNKKNCPDCIDGLINDNSPRRVLQLLGDEWGRQMIHPDIWTMIAKPRIEKLLQNNVRVVINDARFDNDRVNLANWLGASLVDVRSKNSKNDGAGWRSHASELSRPSDETIHYVLQNDEEWPFPGLSPRVGDMLRSLYGDGEDAPHLTS